MSTANLVAKLNARLDKVQADHDEALDSIYMIFASALVFWMHGGFAMLETGSIRGVNAQSVLGKNVVVVCVGSLCWYLVGFGLAAGAGMFPSFEGTAGFAINADSSFQKSVAPAGKPVGPGFFTDDGHKFRSWLFSGMFASACATIASGAMAERTQLKGFLVFVVVMSSWIYPCVAGWVWSGSGWLNGGLADGVVGGRNFVDFAGSTVVHMCGGVSAVVGAYIVGPRVGRFETPHLFQAHNVPILVLGTLILWTGWLGFNGGSTLSLHDAATATTAALVCVNTMLSAAAAGLVALSLKYGTTGKKDVGALCNGILGGLVSITAACAQVSPGEAIAIGCIGGAVYFFAAILVERKLGIDDCVDAGAVHGACGLWGGIAPGLFGGALWGGTGAFHGEGGAQLAVQLAGIVAIAAWTAGWCTLLFAGLARMGALRLTVANADAGDGAPAYQWHESMSIRRGGETTVGLAGGKIGVGAAADAGTTTGGESDAAGEAVVVPGGSGDAV